MRARNAGERERKGFYDSDEDRLREPGWEGVEFRSPRYRAHPARGAPDSAYYRQRFSERAPRYAGRGPRGYRRSDSTIREDVCECLWRHPEIDASDVEVEVKEGVVTLSGTVDRRETKRLTERVVEELPGVQDVLNALKLRETLRM